MHLDGVPFMVACQSLSERTGVALEAGKPISRAAMQYAREEAELCKWWWTRYRAGLRTELQVYFDAEDDLLAESVGRRWRWAPGRAAEFAFFREQVTAAERLEFREDQSWTKLLEQAWMAAAASAT
jgi:hypothetical protein